MPSFAAKRDPNRAPTHPGFLLADTVIPATGKSKSEVARLLGISRQQLYAILDERAPVSPAVAVRLGKLFGKWDVAGHVRRYLDSDKAPRLAQLRERLLAPGRSSNNVRPATGDDALGIIRRSLGQA